jgi:signal peptidase I
MKKIGSYLFNIIGIAILTAIVVVIILTRFGWRVDSVMSGSMEPRIGKGSFVLTRPVEVEDISIGDVIVFPHTVPGEQEREILVIHRVTNTGDGTWFQTKGDANENPDDFVVPAEDVIGRVCFHLPYLGRALQLARTPFGIAVLASCFGLLIVSDVIDSRRQSLAKKKTQAAASRTVKEGQNAFTDRGTRRT